jgi:hypothetical protein
LGFDDIIHYGEVVLSDRESRSHLFYSLGSGIVMLFFGKPGTGKVLSSQSLHLRDALIQFHLPSLFFFLIISSLLSLSLLSLCYYFS